MEHDFDFGQTGKPYNPEDYGLPSQSGGMKITFRLRRRKNRLYTVNRQKRRTA